MISQNFNLMLVSQEQLELCLKNSSSYFRINPQDDMSAFVLFVRHEQVISIMARVRQQEIVESDIFINKLQEYAGLFSVMAEEDMGYRQIQILQDAGIIPVEPEQSAFGHLAGGD